ncbi:hypothetical protein D3C85_752340 [compost metagenome]
MPKVEALRRLGICRAINGDHARQRAQQGIAFAFVGAVVQAVMHQIVFHERLQCAIEDLAIDGVVGLVFLHQHRQQRAVGQGSWPGMSQHVRHRDDVGVVGHQGPAKLVHIRGALFLTIGRQADQAGGEPQILHAAEVGLSEDVGSPVLRDPHALPECPAGGEVQVLLAHRCRLPHRQQAMVQGHALAEVERDFAQGLGVARIGKPRLGGPARQFYEVAWIAGQVLDARFGVAGGRIQRAFELRGGGRQGSALRICRGDAVLEQRQGGEGALAQLGVCLGSVAMQHDGVAHHVQRLGTRIDVAVEIQDALGRQQAGAGRQQRLRGVRRQIAVHARNNDVVENAELAAQVRRLAYIQRQVGRAHAFRRFRALRDQGFRYIHPHRLRVGVGEDERKQSFAGAATDGQHAGALERGGFDPI